MLETTIQKNSITITANQRLARELARLNPARVNELYDLDRFLDELWLHLQDIGFEVTVASDSKAKLKTSSMRLLNKEQQLYLWESLVSNTQAHPIPSVDIINKASLPEKLFEASIILAQWQIPATQIEEFSSLESNYLLTASKAMDALLKKNHYLTRQQSYDIIQAWAKKTTSNTGYKPFKRINLVGFADISPALAQCLNTLATLVDEDYSAISSNISHSPAPQLLEFETFEDEIIHAAQWAKKMLVPTDSKSDSFDHKQPSIAIVVPNLHHDLSQVKSALSQVFEPLSFFGIESRNAESKSLHFYDISAGIPLYEMPIITTIFQCFSYFNQKPKWLAQAKTAQRVKPKIKRDDIIAFNQSHYWGSYNAKVRSEIERQLYKITTPELLISDYLSILNDYSFTLKRQQNEDVCEQEENSKILSALADDIECLTSFHSSQNISANKDKSEKNLADNSFFSSANVMLEKLHIIGWPGKRELNSEEYQACQQFYGIVDRLHQFDELIENTLISLTLVLSKLEKTTKNTVFHMQTQRAPIQVLGSMEAAGIPFDAVRLVGFNQETFPARPNPNPFLPIAIQKKFNTPKSSHEKEYNYSLNFLQHFFHTSSNLIFSYALDKNQTEQQLSSLYNAFFEASPVKAEKENTVFEKVIHSGVEFENFLTISTSNAPALELNDTIPGGASAFNDYIKNPFFAFLKHRLKAYPLNDTSLGLPNSLRGNIVHHVLEEFWHSIGSQENLLANIDNNNEKLHKIISASVKQGVKDHKIQVLPQIIESEIDILSSQLSLWLDIECQRPPFTVLSKESSNLLKLGQYCVNLKIDRIDEVQLVDGVKKIVIDYKTGKVTPSHFEENPPKDCQLPLYAITENISGISYGKINVTGLGYVGLAETDMGIQGIKNITDIKSSNNESWPQKVANWQLILTNIADNIGRGNVPNINYIHTPFLQYLDPISRQNCPLLTLQHKTDS